MEREVVMSHSNGFSTDSASEPGGKNYNFKIIVAYFRFSVVEQLDTGLGRLIFSVSMSHIIRHTHTKLYTRCRTPTSELSACRSGFYLQNQHKRVMSMPSAVFETMFPAIEGLQIYASDPSAMRQGYCKSFVLNYRS